jgi:integrase
VENGKAYSFYREDVERPDGSLGTRLVRHLIGPVGPDGMSERAARQEHARIMEEVNRKRGSVAPAVVGRTFGDAVEMWRKSDAPQLAPSTLRQRNSYLRQHILPRFKDVPTQSVDVVALQEFANSLSQKLAQKTVVNILSAVFVILDFAARRKMAVAKVSFSDLKLGTTKSKLRPFLTREQAAKIIEKSKEPYKTLFTVAWVNGCRAGEILALKVDDLDFSRRVIRIDESADDNTRELRDPKTEHSIAWLPMPSALETVLRNYLENHWTPNPAGLLFPNRKGTHPRWRDNVVKYGLKPVLRKLGIPDRFVGLHSFRYGLATELADQSVPLPVLQKQMRHADVRTTLRVYARAIPESQRMAMESVAASTVTNVAIVTESQN